MKYFSDVTGKTYETVEELELDEASTLAEEEAVPEEPVEEVVEEKPTRKQLAAEVEAADEWVREANVNLEVANKKVEELYQEYLNRAEEIIGPAKKAVKEAHQAKYAAIERFNREFGAYQVTYTGARAADEVLRAMNELNTYTTNMLKRMFWF